jgi:anti-sigma factor RsiW
MKQRMNDEPQSQEAQLARLADGSLPASSASALSAQVDADPALSAALAEQRQALSLLRAVDVAAPASLRAHVQVVAGERTARRSRPARRLVLPALALAVAVVAVVLLAGSGTGAPTVPQTAHLALAAAVAPAPEPSLQHPDRLAAEVDGVPFPNWKATAGWTATGARTDRIGGRRIVTVQYRGPGGQRVGYAIVSGPPLRDVAGRAVQSSGVRFTLARHGPVQFVTWVRAGHTCVIAGTGASITPGMLLALATYRE